MTAGPAGPAPPREIFVSQLGFELSRDGEAMSGQMRVTPEMLVPDGSQPRISVLATAGDVLIGQLANDSSSLILLTVDLAVSLLAPIDVGRLRMHGRIVKNGRTLTSGEATWIDDRGTLVARCWATFMASPRPVDASLRVTPTEGKRFLGSDAPLPTISEPFEDLLGLRRIERGVVEVDRRPVVLQPTGTLQGGVVCALGELAAESALDAPINALDTRYLSGIRSGSGRATATVLAEGVATVEVIDTDRADRVAAVLVARAARA